jgi:hypothetical protein
MTRQSPQSYCYTTGMAVESSFDPDVIRDVIKKNALSPIKAEIVSKRDEPITPEESAAVDLIEHVEAVAKAPAKRKLPQLPKQGMSIKFVNLMLPFVENFWAQYKRYPSTDEFVHEFGISREEVIFINSQKMWLKCLDRRGIRRPNLREDFLSEKQQAAIALITNFHDRRSKQEKLASIGCSHEEYNGWMNDPAFYNAINIRADNVLGNVGVDANVGLASLIQKEDFRAIKFYFEITGKAASPEAINVKQTMQVLIEAVQKHVKDPAVLQAIAEEVNNVRAIQSL